MFWHLQLKIVKVLNNWGLYKTKTDSFILDIANKLAGEAPTSPILLQKL